MTGPTARASAGPTEPASTVALIPTTTPSGEPAATSLASGNADAGGVDREHPTREPCSLGAVTTPIIEDVAFVGGPPAYSADGQWVAFSARPSNGALGPDIYVWHVDDAKARPLTTDHSSVFSAWDVDEDPGRHDRSARVRRTIRVPVSPCQTGRATPPAGAIGWCMAVLWSRAINTGLSGHAPELPVVVDVEIVPGAPS